MPYVWKYWLGIINVRIFNNTILLHQVTVRNPTVLRSHTCGKVPWQVSYTSKPHKRSGKHAKYNEKEQCVSKYHRWWRDNSRLRWRCNLASRNLASRRRGSWRRYWADNMFLNFRSTGRSILSIIYWFIHTKYFWKANWALKLSVKWYLFSVLIRNSFDFKLNRILLNAEVEKTKRRITSPDSAMITSTAGRSPGTFGTFSVVIKDLRETVSGKKYSFY